jgi:hypothetical protein
VSTETLRQVAVLVAGTVVIPYFVLVLLLAVQNKRPPYGNATVLPTLFVGVAVVFLSRRLGPRIDAALGLPNASWLAGYGFGAVGFFFAGLFAWHAGKRQADTRIGAALRVGLVLALAGMTALYLLFITGTAEWPSRTPRSWQEALFSSLTFIYAGAVSLLALDASLWTIVNEEHDGAAQRALFALIGAAFATICFALKIAFVWLHVAGYDAGALDRLALWAMVVATFGLLGAILPQRIHNRLAGQPPVHTWRTLADLRRLERLHARIRAVQPSVPYDLEFTTWWQRLLHADEALYQTVIALHDAKRVLAALPADTDAAAQRQALLTQLATLDRLDERGYAETLRALRTAAQELERRDL